jgi:hypothetical protein
MLQFDGISKSFAGARAPHDVSFEVARGGVHTERTPEQRGICCDRVHVS